MRSIIKLLTTLLFLFLCVSCYDRDVIDTKDFNFTLPDVQNISYTKEGNIVRITWQIPNNISEDFKRPLETKLQIVEDDIYRDVRTVYNEEAFEEITIVPDKKYRVVVKLFGYIKDEVKENGKTDKIYSKGQVLELEY